MRYLFLGMLLCCSVIAFSQITAPTPYLSGAKVSYSRSWEATAPETNADTLKQRSVFYVKQTTQYVDGFGRPIQTVQKQISPDQKDMVAAAVYDEYGRETLKFLPYESVMTVAGTDVTNDGNFKINAFQQQKNFSSAQYPGETFFYGKTKFEPSPLNRVLENFAPGNSWVGSDSNSNAATHHSTRMAYLTNSTTDSVRIWAVNSNGTYTTSSTYAQGQLFKMLTYDEHNKKVVEFKDKEGKVILRRVQLADSVNNGHYGWLCTYYVYDEYNNLRLVIPPKAVELIAINSWNLTYTSTLIPELCFLYEYDNRNRLIAKRVPGSGTVSMVYDITDRLIMTQDTILKIAGKWMVTEYDNLNRVLRTGLWENSSDRASHQSSSGTLSKYPSAASLASNYEILTEQFYDNYDWVSGSGSGLNAYPDSSKFLNSNFFYTTYGSYPVFAERIRYNTSTRGLATGSRIKVLNSSPEQYLYSVNFYDDKARLIQSQKINSTGGKDIATIQYDFSGKVLRSLLQHEFSDSVVQKHIVLTKMEYDHAGRLLIVKKTVNSHIGTDSIAVPERIILENSYDHLGQLAEKKIGNKPGTSDELESLQYEYNIRGWLLGMNRNYAKDSTSNNYFGFDLGYDKLLNGIIGNQAYANPQYNGNIEGTVWKSRGDDQKRKYDFSYDNANRIMAANFNQYTGGSFNKNANVDFSVSNLAYDANGNILSMKQQGLKLTTSSAIDQLAYNYYATSNKLLNVIDSANDASTKLGDFRTSTLHPNSGAKTSSTVDYTYDVNGNLKKDLNKDIGTSSATGITYNYLNLPQSITVRKSGGIKGIITYTYDAGGNKLKKETVDSSTSGKVIKTATTYIDGFVYESKITTPANSPNDNYVNVLQFIPHEEGRICFKPSLGIDSAAFVYDYFIKDHLGNVRMVITEEVKQDIYPAATFEDSVYNGGTAVSIENLYYNIDASKVVPKSTSPNITDYSNNNGNPPYNNNPYSNTAANSGKMYQMNANTNPIGLGIVLKVMAGDKVNIFAKSFHETSVRGGYADPVSPLSLTDILNSFITNGTIAPKGVTTSQITSTPGFPTSIFEMLGDHPDQEFNVLKASINWIVLDEQFKYVSGGFDMVGIMGSVKEHNASTIPTIDIPKNGYIYVYCSNESNYDVFFDNLQLIHTRGQILEETHYYPFGLTMSGICSKAASIAPNSEYTFQGQRFDDDLGINWVQFKWRNHDPQIGRFVEIDPLSEKYNYNSTYSFSENKVTTHRELEGLEGVRYDEVDENGKKTKTIIEKNVIVLVQSTSTEYSNKKNKKIEKKNNAKIRSVTNELNNYYNGGNGAKTTDGQKVEFKFNIIPLSDNVGNIKSNSDRDREYLKISDKYSLMGTTNTDLTADGVPTNFIDRPVGAAVITNEPPVGTENVGEARSGVIKAYNSSGAFAHEIIHTLAVDDNGYKQGGVLSEYPQRLLPAEVDLIIKASIKRK